MTDEHTSDDAERAAAGGDSVDDQSSDGFESERTATRAEAAAVLRGLADGVDAGAVAIGAGEDAVTATVPEEFDLELEYETDGDEAEIEVELEWTREREAEADPSEAERDADEPSGQEPAEDERPAVETATVEAAAAAAGDTGVESGSDEGASARSDEGTGAEGDAHAAPVVEPVAPLSSQARFEVYRDRANEWRWRLVHRNGNVIAASGEGYTRRHNAEKGLRSVVRNAPDAEVVEDDR